MSSSAALRSAHVEALAQRIVENDTPTSSTGQPDPENQDQVEVHPGGQDQEIEGDQHVDQVPAPVPIIFGTIFYQGTIVHQGPPPYPNQAPDPNDFVIQQDQLLTWPEVAFRFVILIAV